jgi:hypothetical protein
MIVGILGKKRSGKDTTGDYLVANKNFVKYSFANPIKRGAMELFGFTEDQVFGDAKDEIDPTWGITPRLVLQIMGTEDLVEVFGLNVLNNGITKIKIWMSLFAMLDFNMKLMRY